MSYATFTEIESTITDVHKWVDDAWVQVKGLHASFTQQSKFESFRSYARWAIYDMARTHSKLYLEFHFTVQVIKLIYTF